MWRLRPSGLLAATALGAAGAALAVLADGAVASSAGEPLWLRWVRAAADHPVRTAAAGLCLALALRRRSGGGQTARTTDPGVSKGDGAPPEC